MKNSGIFRGYKNKTRLKSMFQAVKRRLSEPKQAFFCFFLAICKTEKAGFHAGFDGFSNFSEGAEKSGFWFFRGFFGDETAVIPFRIFSARSVSFGYKWE